MQIKQQLKSLVDAVKKFFKSETFQAIIFAIIITSVSRYIMHIYGLDSKYFDYGMYFMAGLFIGKAGENDYGRQIDLKGIHETAHKAGIKFKEDQA